MDYNDVVRVLPVWFLVVLSYLIPSVFFKTQQFYWYTILWQLMIIVIVLKSQKENLCVDKRLIKMGLLLGLNFVLVRIVSPQINILTTITGVITAPIMEELLFRNWFLSQIRGSFKHKMVFSSFLFGLYHLKNVFILQPVSLLFQVCYAGMFIGPVFAWIRIKTGSIYPVILFHSINNMLGSTVTERFFKFIIVRTNKFGW